MYNTFIDTLGVDIVHIKDNIYICCLLYTSDAADER